MNLPRQAIAFSSKDEKWCKESVDYYIGLSRFGTPVPGGIHYEIQQCYDAYEGRLNMEHYNYVLKPFGENTPKVSEGKVGFPAKIKCFNIIKFIVDLLHGEYIKRPKNFTVIATNADVENQRTEALKHELAQTIAQQFINKLNEQGVDTGVDSEETPDLQTIVAKYERSTWRDTRAKNGQIALDYIFYKCEVDDIFKKGFLDFLISGFVFTLKEPVNDEIRYECVDPRDVDFDRNPNNDFVEDGDWAVSRYVMSVSQIIDIYGRDLTEDEVVELEKLSGTTMPSYTFSSTGFESLNPNELEVIRVFWKSKKRYGVLTYTDEYGKVQEMEVDETYKVDKANGETIEWFWENQVWEGTRIANKYYKRVKPILVQRGGKLPMNGRSYYSRNTGVFSLVSIGIPFQVTYNILKFRLELSIARAKDKIGKIDLREKPKHWKLEDWLMFGEALGWLPVDYKDYKGNPQHSSVLDLGFSQYLRLHLELMDSLVMEWSRLAGVTPQRLGNISSSETVGGVERSVNQSALSTEIYNDLYEHFEVREYTGLLDYTKFTWIEGKKAWFYKPETGNMYLDIDGIQHSETEFGVFVSNSSKEYNKLQVVKGLAERMLQANVPASAVIETLDSENVSMIKEKMKAVEEAQNQMQQQMQQQEQQMQQAQMQAQAEMQDKQLAYDAEQRRLDRENKIQVAMIGSQNNEEPDYASQIEVINIDRQKLELDASKAAREYELKSRELSMKERIENNKMDTQKQIARMKPSPKK